MKRLAILFSLLFTFAIAAQAQGLAIGGTMENFSLTDTNGKTQTLNDVKGTNGVVIIFVSSQCPVVRGYNDRMNQLAIDYKAKGINVVGVNANVTESPTEIKAHGEATYKFPVLIDKNSVLADKLNANSTPEAFFVDAKNVLLYHGAIDNDRSGRNVTEPYLRNAFDASLAGKKVEKASTVAFGCTIKKPEDGN
jgi:peroxiredoxin